jgi:hypothetical protein
MDTKIRTYGLLKHFTSSQNDKILYENEITLENRNHSLKQLVVDVKKKYDHITLDNLDLYITISNPTTITADSFPTNSISGILTIPYVVTDNDILYKGCTLHIVNKDFQRYRITLQNSVNISFAVCNNLQKTMVVLDKYLNKYRYGKIEELNWWDGSTKKLIVERFQPSKLFGVRSKPKCQTFHNYEIDKKHQEKLFDLKLQLIELELLTISK